MNTRYRKLPGATVSLKYSLAWCPKYRRPVLTPVIADRLKALLTEKAAELSITVHALEVMPEHVRLVIETDPTLCVAEIANRLKGYTSHVLRREFKELTTKLPTLWSRSYYACTLGQSDEAAVADFITAQRGK